MSNASSQLTPKQARFVEEYLVDLNATRAYRDAGYSGSENVCGVEGHKLLSNPKVSSVIQAAMDARSERTEITADYVLTTIYETVERCKQAKLVLDRRGDPVMVELPTGELAPAYAFDSGAVLKGAELLGKHLKLFTDKVEVSGAIAVADAIAAGRKRVASIAGG